MYGEYFDIPQPDELLFISSFSGGEVFRSGCCFRRGQGRIFYFSPGHELYPIYYQPEIQRILANAARWVRPVHPIRTERFTITMSPTVGFIKLGTERDGKEELEGADRRARVQWAGPGAKTHVIAKK